MRDKLCCTYVALRTIAAWLVLCVGLSQLAVVESFANYQPIARCYREAVVSASKSSSRTVVTSWRASPTELRDCSLVRLHSKSPENESNQDGDFLGDPQPPGSNTPALVIVGSQSALIGVAAVAAAIIGTPNYGLGPGIDFSVASISVGSLYVVPLVVVAALLDIIEARFPALQEVSKATQRSVLVLMGGTFRPLYALAISVALGLAAGFGEEMLFRGVFQYEVASRWGTMAALATSSVVFGLLHAVTPLYAILATIASVYFGAIYIATDNLAVPISCHTVYDIGALLYAHWSVCQLSLIEREALSQS
jgi:uncharacterized protein